MRECLPQLLIDCSHRLHGHRNIKEVHDTTVPNTVHGECSGDPGRGEGEVLSIGIVIFFIFDSLIGDVAALTDEARLGQVVGGEEVLVAV